MASCLVKDYNTISEELAVAKSTPSTTMTAPMKCQPRGNTMHMDGEVLEEEQMSCVCQVGRDYNLLAHNDHLSKIPHSTTDTTNSTLEYNTEETAITTTKSTSTKGACTYDVCSGRGEGGTPKADAVREVA